MLLTREEILSAKDIQQETVKTPEWKKDGEVIIRGLNGEGRDDYEMENLVKRGKNYEINMRNARARLIAKTAVNKEGKLLFKETDILALGKKSAVPMERCFDVARRLSGLKDEDIEELAGNSVSELSD